MYNLTQADVDSITLAEYQRGTTRFLPKKHEIPEDFCIGNVYTRIAESLHFGEAIEEADVVFNKGFKKDAGLMRRIAMAHLNSMEPSTEHKTAGVGFMLSKIVTITEKK